MEKILSERKVEGESDDCFDNSSEVLITNCKNSKMRKRKNKSLNTSEVIGAKEPSAQITSPSPEMGRKEKQCTANENITSGKVKPIDPVSVREEGKVSPKEVGVCREAKAYYSCLLILSFASFGSRFYNIELPRHVCWDETHFGKMGSWYINRTFFFDVHPPLGKMLIGLSGYLTGYNGSFPFAKPGDEYGETEYVGMRMFCAALGALLVPLSYSSVWILTKSLVSSIIAACFVLFDIGTLTLSRHILLDPILMFFIMLSVYCKLKFLSYQSRPFSLVWWFWLCSTGISLACSIGVKFVGLFIILHIGLTTAYDLWNLLKDSSLKMGDILKHFIGRAMCLIALPIAAYLIFFAIHFKILNKSGSGDGFYSSGFQAQLGGNKLYNISMPENVAYGSVITLKQRRTGGAYLHSHWHLYPEQHPPRQQQVTTYSHKDDNNVWIIKPATRGVDMSEPPEFVKAGDLIRLEHVPTQRNLHAHREPAPLTKTHFQVSCYGVNGTGDANDIWVVEVIGAAASTPIQTVRSKLKLIHYHVRCGLQSHDKKLPKWGWEQQEVTCNPNLRSKNIVWSVEEVIDARLPNVSFDVYSPTLFEKFMESHAVMTQGNSGLKPKEGEITSRPWQWPITYRGQMFSGSDHRIYLLGNPVLFWTVMAVIIVYLLMFLVYSFRIQRGMKVHPEMAAYKQKMFGACWWLLMGWAFHYLPFWPMTRVLYFHHYFPAYLFGAMLSGVVFDYFITMLCINVPDSLEIPVFHLSLGSLLAAIVGSFYLFHPLTYGTSGPLATEEGSIMYRLKWLETWEF